MLVMTPFSLPPKGLPVLRKVMTSHSSTLAFSPLMSIKESTVLKFHPLVHPVSSGTFSLIVGLASGFHLHVCLERGRLKG